jgi:hypothetical protein
VKKFIDIALWSTLAFLLIPSGLILASWNAIPGDPLYVVKTGLEKTLLTVTPSSVWQGSLQVKYTERRFEEAAQLLANNYANTDMSVDLASAGLTNLNNQVNETTQTIAKIQDPAQKAAIAKQYLKTLRTVSTKLSQQQNTTGGSAYPQAPTTQYQQTQQQGSQQQQPTVINQTIVYQTTVVQQTNQTGGTGTTGTTAPSAQTQTQAVGAQTTQQAAATSTTTTASPAIETQISQTQQTVNQNIEEMQQIANEGNGNGNGGNGGQNNGNNGNRNGGDGGEGNGNSGNNGNGNGQGND